MPISSIQPEGLKTYNQPVMSFKAWRMRVDVWEAKPESERGNLPFPRWVWCDLSHNNPKVADQLRYGMYDIFTRPPRNEDEWSAFFEEVQSRW